MCPSQSVNQSRNLQKPAINLKELPLTALSVFHFKVDDGKLSIFLRKKIQIIVFARILEKYVRETRIVLEENLAFKFGDVATILGQIPRYSVQLLDDLKDKKFYGN